jgi:hypothetical protein
MPINIVFFPTQTSPENNNISKAEYTKTQQDLTVGWCKITNYLDMQRFLASELFYWKTRKSRSLVSRFNSNSSGFTITK